MEKNAEQKMNNNVNVAIMNKVNELAARYGIEPYEMLICLRYEMQLEARTGVHEMTGKSILQVESLPEDRSKFERCELMLESIGFSLETDQLIGTDEPILKVLDKGLAMGPRTRVR